MDRKELNLIADLFSRIHFGEKIGSGMQRMREICKTENTPYPKIYFTDTHFYITFFPSREYMNIAGEVKKTGEWVTEKVTEKVTENQIKILKGIKKDAYVTAKRLCAELGISERKIKENIRKLKEKGLVKRVGPAKGGRYLLSEKAMKIID